MTHSGSHTLREVREDVLGYEFEAAVRYSGVERERLTALEEGRAEPTVFEAYALGRVYGIDADLLASSRSSWRRGTRSRHWRYMKSSEISPTRFDFE